MVSVTLSGHMYPTSQTMSFETLPLWKIAYCVLYPTGSLHVSRLLERVRSLGWTSNGMTPLQTLKAELRRHSVKSRDVQIYFQNLGQATWELTQWGRLNPPEGVMDILKPTVQGLVFIRDQNELQDNLLRYTQSLNNKSVRPQDVLREQYLFYDEQRHQFAPVRWMLIHSWSGGVDYSFPLWEDCIQCLEDIGYVQSQKSLHKTRFVQWWHEWLLGEGKEQIRIDVEADIHIFVSTSKSILEHSQFVYPIPQLDQIEFDMQARHPTWVFDEEVVRRIHLSWQSSANHFLLLSGLTGIGKSNLIWDYAGVILESMGLSLHEHRLLVSVQTNFRDPSPLFGYVNSFTEPAVFVYGLLTQFLLDAYRNPDKPYFLLLDETNLAKMEQYLAPLISTFEVDAPLVFHNHSGILSGVPSSMTSWPKNIWIAGTMNFEMGAHPPPDKILDRAHSIEVWDVNVEEWFVLHPRCSETVRDCLVELNVLLRPTLCHFGYRSLESMVQYIQAGMVLGRVSEHRLLDEAILSKVLPKVKGGRQRWTNDLCISLINCCIQYKLELCRVKIEALRTQISSVGVVRFWN